MSDLQVAPLLAGVQDLGTSEIEIVNGGVAWFVIPMVAIATHLASEYYHHHM